MSAIRCSTPACPPLGTSRRLLRYLRSAGSSCHPPREVATQSQCTPSHHHEVALATVDELIDVCGPPLHRGLLLGCVCGTVVRACHTRLCAADVIEACLDDV